MYKSPIEILTTDIYTQIMKQEEQEIYKAVVNTGVVVDKEELLRALKYDRMQYSAGFRDGKQAALDSIVRCKECKYLYDGMDGYCCKSHRGLARICEGSFCSYGERREGE